MYASTDWIPLSALQHYLFCPRQCALIHLEQIWTENVYTAEGRLLHEKAHQIGKETRGDMKTVTSLWLCSQKFGISGQADVVEFQRRNNVWHPYPVEYKRGRSKTNDADRIQLCAQARCLEEMLGIAIPEGALFYGKTRRRHVVTLDDRLRETTCRVASAVHDLFRYGVTPPPPRYARKTVPSLLIGGQLFTCVVQAFCITLRSKLAGEAMKQYLNTLFITTQESYLAKDGECVAVHHDGVLKAKIPIHTLDGLVLFGQISCSPFLLGHCAENKVTVSWLTEYGRFLASMHGPVSGNQVDAWQTDVPCASDS